MQEDTQNIVSKSYRGIVFRQRILLLFILIAIGAAVFVGYYFFRKHQEQLMDAQPVAIAEESLSSETYIPEPVAIRAHENESRWPILPPPPDPKMDFIKTRGCVADGLLNGYGGDEQSSAAMINRSQCYYLHRSLETWLEPPDFEEAYKIHQTITKPNTVYGMFIAEALDTAASYEYPIENRDFDFGKMCRNGSKNFWGEHTCKPTLESAEYRRYVEYITERAMDLGVQVFLFGQVFYQDASDLDKTHMPEVIADMREYAEFRGMKIFIGAQTNDIKDESYLRQFDFIEGGVGIDDSGNIEDGSCLSRWWKKPGDWCWALLWNEEYLAKANNVLIHLDWSGKVGDDMGRFTRMGKGNRETTLEKLYRFFTQKKIGFLMPVMARLSQDNEGCYGRNKHFYSASRKYLCDDEEAINRILGRK